MSLRFADVIAEAEANVGTEAYFEMSRKVSPSSGVRVVWLNPLGDWREVCWKLRYTVGSRQGRQPCAESKSNPPRAWSFRNKDVA